MARSVVSVAWLVTWSALPAFFGGVGQVVEHVGAKSESDARRGERFVKDVAAL
jgi:hypothetical protein